VAVSHDGVVDPSQAAPPLRTLSRKISGNCGSPRAKDEIVPFNGAVMAPASRDGVFTPLGNVPNVLVVATSKGIKTIHELVARAKATPGSSNYASGGTGTPPHLTAERFRVSAGFTGQHIPFRGAPEAVTEVPRRFLFLADCARAAVHPRRQAHCSCGEQHQALIGAAGRTHHCGGRLREFRF
jgi:hypothetical protein